jgi:hypothetical protein
MSADIVGVIPLIIVAAVNDSFPDAILSKRSAVVRLLKPLTPY